MIFSRYLRVGLIAMLGLIAASCGGGGGGGSGSSGTPAPSGFSYSSAPAFVVGQQITSLSPTIVGSVIGYSVTPSLPAGLTIDPSSGVISGTPTVIVARTSYTVTASGPGGHITTQVSIVVDDLAPAISYSSPTYSFTAGVAGQVPKPNVSGGAVTGWAITPDLPNGLSLSSTDGSISGTATASAAAAASQ